MNEFSQQKEISYLEEITSIKNFQCPANNQHILASFEKYENHLHRCKELAGLTMYYCRFFKYHTSFSREQRNLHEMTCKFNNLADPIQEQDNFIIFSNNENKNVHNHNLNQNIWWEKNKEKIQVIKEKKRVIKNIKKQIVEEREEMIEKDNMKLYKKTKEFNEKIQNIPVKSKEYLFDFIGPNFDHFEMVLFERGNFPFKSHLFKIEKFESIYKYPELFNSNTNLYKYKKWLGGEFIIKDLRDEYDGKNLAILENFLNSEIDIGINTSKENSHGEILLVFSRNTRFLGKFMNKFSKIGVFVFNFEKYIIKNDFKMKKNKNENIFEEKNDVKEKISYWLQKNEEEISEINTVFLGKQSFEWNNVKDKYISQMQLYNEIEFLKKEIKKENESRLFNKETFLKENNRLKRLIKETKNEIKENEYTKIILMKKLNAQEFNSLALKNQFKENLKLKIKKEKELLNHSSSVLQVHILIFLNFKNF